MVQKLYYCAMAGPSDVMKPEKFGDENFKRWQTRVKFWLMSMNLWWVISPTVERHSRRNNSIILRCLQTRPWVVFSPS